MRRSFQFLPLLAVALLATTVIAIEPTSTAVSPDGTRAIVDLPSSKHMRNTGGSDGSGLCVFTSIQHAGYWQNIKTIEGFRKFMESQPGGGYPEKVDAMLEKFCKSKGVPVPRYIQHNGGDEEFLDLAFKTDRIVCMTYAGQDDFYRNQTIAHMVNGAHLDPKNGAIIDNNRPGSWVWMTRKQLLNRWRGLDDNGNPLYARDGIGRRFPVGGGWAIVFLDAPPPPYIKTPTQFIEEPGVVYGQRCVDGKCYYPPAAESPKVEAKGDGWHEEIISGEKCWKYFRDGKFVGVYYGKGWHPARDNGWTSEAYELPVELSNPTEHQPEHLTGVIPHKVTQERRYQHNGKVCTRHEAFAALSANGLTDDSNHWHLSIVGDLSFCKRVQADISQLSDDIKDKLLVQAYAADDWAVSQFSLLSGVNLRRPSPGREAPDVASVTASEYEAAKLTWLLQQPGGPLPPPPPILPNSEPTPSPVPNSPIGPLNVPNWVWPVALLGIILVLRRN